MDTQAFALHQTIPNQLSFWEEAEVKRQIDAMVALGKMKPSTSEYVCRVTLLVKKDGSHQSPILWRLYDSESTNQKGRLPNAIGLGHPDTTEGSLNGLLLWIFSQDFGSKNGTSGCSEDNFDHQVQIV